MDALKNIQQIVKSIPVMALPPKTIEQLQGEAEARDILWCLDAMQDWEEFIIKVNKVRGMR